MDSLSTLSAAHPRYAEEARSALARYLDHAIAEQGQVAALVAGTTDAVGCRRRRDALVQARRVLDADGPSAVPTMVIAGAVGHWQARFDEADDRILGGQVQMAELGRLQIDKVTALLAVNALTDLARSRGMSLGGPGLHRAGAVRRGLAGAWAAVRGVFERGALRRPR
ncbi:hypothetical protein ACOQFV_23990 [Nocardiopsis changdeensis]|uniref:Uncharacterized protein n=1 Tax=Nocardiopsis changdeensis TaxID=2831969 RepID=A0A975QCC5_9ACTN|nr:MULTISPECIES: hypothetical protein [Nocardiopsis]QUX26544.1 hypothetical protein KGD84_33130 [Nocardiopsis changdeensis]QYX40663.1 hypothetical protein K1J57_32200 [Nocardiopsis sp. MT53]